MQTPNLQHRTDRDGVHVMLQQSGTPLRLGDWGSHHPTAGAALTHLPHNPDATELRLSHTQLSAMTDFNAVALGLPRAMEAWVSVSVEGRIESDGFRVTTTLEPLQHAHPWVVYAREGAVLSVGQRRMRLNPGQLDLFEALDAMREAGADITARLQAWPLLSAALNAQHQSLIRTVGPVPRLHLARVAAFPPQARVRRAGRLVPATAENRWAMGPRHRYYLLAS